MLDLLTLAQGIDLPWEKIAGLSGASVLGLVGWLFLTDRIRATSVAEKQIQAAINNAEIWRQLYYETVRRAEKSEEMVRESVGIAAKGVEAVEKVVQKSAQQRGP